MNRFATASLAVLTLSALFIVGCQTSHTETDKTNILGQHKHEETTAVKNPITGDTSVQHTESKSGGL